LKKLTICEARQSLPNLESLLAAEGEVTTIRINEEQLRQLRAIAEFENRSLADIFSEMAEEYISSTAKVSPYSGSAVSLRNAREASKK